jgi:hypothetical protein
MGWPTLLPMLAEGGAIQRTDFEWGNPFPAWLTFGIIVLLVGVVAWCYRREGGGASGLVRGFLGALRVILVLVVLALICEPQFTTRSEIQERSTIAVLVDRSRSMSLSDRYAGVDWASSLTSYLQQAAREAAAEEAAGGADAGEGDQEDEATAVLRAPASVAELQRTPRIDIARIAATDLARRLEESHELEWFAFDSTLARDLRAAEIEAEGTETRLGDAILQAQNDLSGRTLSGIVVFTDGQSNGGAVTPEEVAERLTPPDGIPVWFVGIGDPTPPRDIWVSDLHAPERALVGDTVVFFDFVVGNYGFDAEECRVVLEVRRAEDPADIAPIVSETFVTLGGTSERVKEQLRHRFRDEGDYVCTVRAITTPGEIDEDNNTATLNIKVIDRRIRVLYIEGYPRWEYRALVRAMIRDESLEVYCLLQTADIDFPQEVTPGYQRLRRFPPAPGDGADDPLFDFDVVLVGDVDLDPRWDIELGRDDRDRLATFVENVGGGVAFISGLEHNPAAYQADESLRKLLPVIVDDPGSASYLAYRDPWRLKLTPAGAGNAMLRLSEDQRENRRLLEAPTEDGGLPAFYWYYPVDMVKPTAQVLATHPTARTPIGQPMPVMAIQQIGRGKVFWTGTDDLWRWRWRIGDRFYYRFWGQVIRGLAQGKLLGSSRRVSLYTTKRDYTLGEQVEISAEVLDSSYKPVDSRRVPEVEVEIHASDSLAEPTRLVLLPQASPTGLMVDGHYRTVFIPRDVGTYRVTLQGGPGLDLGESTPPETVFRVREPAVEMENPFLAEARLAAVAGRTGKRHGDADIHGELRLPHQVPELSAELPVETRRIPDDSIPPIRLWHPDRAQLLLWLVLGYTALLSLEWIARKLNRML